jgi:hypothetical protein
MNEKSHLNLKEELNNALYLGVADLPAKIKAALVDPTGIRTMDPKTLKRHPISAQYLDLPPLARSALVEDIKKNGLREPILLFRGMVVDGWQRCQACIEAGVPIRGIDLPEEAEPFLQQLARSCNIVRREMDSGQRAVIAAKVAGTSIQKGIHERSKNLKQGSAAGKEKEAAADATTTAVRMAELYLTNTTYFGQAWYLVNEHPGIAEQVLAGDYKLNKGIKKAKEVEDARRGPQAVEEPSPTKTLQVIQREPVYQLDAFPAGSESMIAFDCPKRDLVFCHRLASSVGKALKPGGLLLCISNWKTDQNLRVSFESTPLKLLYFGFVSINEGRKSGSVVPTGRMLGVYHKPSQTNNTLLLRTTTVEMLNSLKGEPMVLVGPARGVWRRLLEIFHPPD